MITLTCLNCGKTFDVANYRAEKAKYCSRQCYLEHRWQGNGKCPQCGEPATTIFCTPECQKRYWDKNGYELQKRRRNWERKIDLIRSLGEKCAHCGNNDIRVLAVHHIDPDTKVHAKDRQWNWNRRFRDWEANSGNLQLLCANCHRIETWNQMGYGVGLELPQSVSRRS